MFQRVMLSLVIFFACSVVLFFLLIKVIDFNEYKPKIYKIFKESTGYELVIRGDIAPSLSPVGMRIFDVEIANPNHSSNLPLATLSSFDVALDLFSLLKKEIKVNYINIDGLTLVVERLKDGKHSYEITTKEPTGKINKKAKKDLNATSELPFYLVNVNKVKFTNANVLYSELDNNSSKVLLENLTLDMNNISYDSSKHRFHGLYFTAEASMSAMHYHDFIVNDISMSFEMKDAILSSEHLQYTIFEAPFQGSGKFDFSGKQPHVSLKNKTSKLNLLALSKIALNSELFEGNVNSDIKLSFFANDAQTFKSTLSGYAHIGGSNIKLRGYNVDKIITSLNSVGTQSDNTTKDSSGDETLIQEVNAKVNIGYSEVQLSDVAFSTQKNRVALNGSINIAEDKFTNVQIALLDKEGGAIFVQKIDGAFPKYKNGIFESASNIKLSFNISKKEDANLTKFYEGVVKHPSKNAEDETAKESEQ